MRGPMLWGAVVVSVIVLALFTAVCLILFLRGAPNSDALSQIVGGLVQLAGMVVGFWVGSSVGSMQKSGFLLTGGHSTQPHADNPDAN